MSKQRVALTAVIGGTTVFGLKLSAYFMSGSVALLSDALESIINITASLMMFYAVYISGIPSDEEHHYGHQKIEEISSLLEGGLIITAALFIIHEAIGKIFNPGILTKVEASLSVSLFATALNGGLSWHLNRTARKYESMALEGDSKHLLSDVITSIGVIAGLLIAQFTGWVFLDPLIALLLSALILRMGISLILKSSKRLMDRHSPEVEAGIMTILKRHSSQYVDFHDVKTRRSGSRIFAELHLTVDGLTTVEEAHDLTEHLEEDLRAELPEITITIHLEPSKPEK